jgi:hypothetical protein
MNHTTDTEEQLMPYLVIVYAKNRKAAEAVYNANHPEDGTTHRVVAVYAFPTRDEELSTHTPCAGFGHKTMSWTRSLVGGFMTCQCGGRHPQWRRRVAGGLLDHLGFNLLHRDQTPKLFRNPGGVVTSETI